MVIQLLISATYGGEQTDRTADIVIDSLTKEDNINEQKDTLKFQVRKYGIEGFTPHIGEIVEMNIDGAREFFGAIVNLEKSIQAGQMVVYDVTCSDCSICLGRELVLERFDDEPVGDIIDFILDKYASAYGFTDTTYVKCEIEVETMVFNRLTVPECLEKLAKTVGYSWYSDHYRRIHFFPKNENPSPFEITDTNGKYLQNTLKIKDDLSQIRNKVTIRGAEARGIEKTESYIADGDQIMFPLSNKFAEKPTVYVQNQATTTTVGVDYLNAEEDYDCFWNYNEKYIRFKNDTKPAVSKKVDITGIPLFPVIVKISDPVSIAKYHIYEFFKEDKSITSRAEALRYAQAQLEAYSNGVIEGSFQTDVVGLRSGQIISIDSDLMDVDEDFLIQRVQFRTLAKDKGMWSVTLATMRTVGIIQVLQDLIRFREIREFDPENILTYLQFSDAGKGLDVIGTPSTSKIPYFWVGAAELGLENPIKYNFWTYDDTTL